MKRRISSVFFAVVLVLSMSLVTAAPTVAENCIVFELGTPVEHDTAAWATDKNTSDTPGYVSALGSNSVKLSKTEQSADGPAYVEFVPDPGITMVDLATIETTSFWYYFPESESNCGPQLELLFTSEDYVPPTEGDLYDPSDGEGFAIVWLGPLHGVSASGLELVENEWTELVVGTTTVCAIYKVLTPGGVQTYDEKEWTLATILDAINESTEMKNEEEATADAWELTRVRAELWEPEYTAWSSYIDNITIDGTTYELELEFSLTGVEADPPSFNPAVAPTTIRATATPWATLYFAIFNELMSVKIRDDVALTETDSTGVYQGDWDGKNDLETVMPEGTYVVAVIEADQTFYTYGCEVEIDTTPPVMLSAVTRYEFQLHPQEIGSTYIDVTFDEDIATATADDFAVTNPDCNIVGDPTIADSVVTLRVSLVGGGGLKGHETPTVTLVVGDTVTDIGGNAAVEHFIVADDGIKPTLSDIVEDEDDCINAGETATVITGNTEPGATVTVTITDGTTPVTGSADADADGSFTVIVDVSGLDDGELTKTIVAEDDAEPKNVSDTWSPDVEPCKDTVLPVVTIDELDGVIAAPWLVDTATPEISGTAVDINPCCTEVVVEISIDGGVSQEASVEDGAWSFTTDELTSGPHSVVVTAKDCCGNIGYAGLEFVVDLVVGYPVILDAVTGWNWWFCPIDPEDVPEEWTEEEWARFLETHAYNPGIGYAFNANDRSTIMVVFSEPLDPATVDKTDFTVTGHRITEIALRYGHCNHPHEWDELSTSDFGLVFLKVTPLMSTYAEPTVNLEDTVSDYSGLESLPGYVVAQDGIAPVITLSSAPEEPVYNQPVTIKAESTEELFEAYCGLPKEGDFAMTPDATGKVWTYEFLWPYPPMEKIHIKVWAHDETAFEECKWWKHEKCAEESLIFGGGDYVGIDLCEGWNLISVPKELVNPSLNDVFWDGSVTKVHHWTGYVWQSAKFNPISGTWGVGIRDIVPGKGYWVWCSPNEYHLGLLLALPDPELWVPPAYSLVKGWNLVGFTALDYPLDDGKCRCMNEYLFSLCDVCKLVYWYSDQAWYRATPLAEWWEYAGECDYPMIPGYGYWLYLAKAGILAP